MQEGKIAGHAFWSWNDVRQYARLDWPTHEGTLFSGVVTESREPYPELYMRLSRLFLGRPEFPESSSLGHDVPAADAPVATPLRLPIVERGGQTQIIDLQKVIDSASGVAAWESIEKAMAAFWPKMHMAREQWERTGKRLRFWRTASVEISGVSFGFAFHDGFVRPVVVTPENPEIVIPIAQDCDRIYILGNVTLPSGYPLEGKLGERAGVFEIRYADGRSESVPLRNGYEIAGSSMVYNATRIEPLALAAPQALTFEKDPARERYQVLLFALPARGQVTELRCKWESGPPLLTFAVTTQKGGKS